MQRRLALWVSAVSCAAALSSACGSSSGLDSKLAPTGVTLTSLTISVATPSVGGGTQATATATFSNGSNSAVASGFGSDTPSVATVTSGGAVTGVAIGDVTIFVDYQGMRASKKVHVLPSYSGTFVGSYSVTACSETGGFVSTNPDDDFCTGLVGLTGAIALQSTQPADLTTLTGLFQLGGVVGNGGGAVSSSGVMTYSGSASSSTTRLEFRNFIATSPSPGRITGSFELVFTDSTLAGQGVITGSNLDMTRQSSALALSASPSSVPFGRLSAWTSLLRGLRIQ
jgi:hypothetical protein